jgi:secreted trypsin-like serine protease
MPHSISKLLLVVALTFVVSACGGGSDDSSDSGDSGGSSGGSFALNACDTIGLARDKVANGSTCSAGDNPLQSSMVRLRISSITGSEAICSGVVIDSFTVLTAAHCLARSPLSIAIDTTGGTIPAASFATADDFSIEPSPFFSDRNVFFNDIAVIFTDTALPVSSSPILLSRSPIIGEEAIIAGFGEFNPGALDGVIRAGNVSINNVTSNHIFVSFQNNEAHPCNGDSGSPIFIVVGGVPAIAGVVSQSDPQVDTSLICREGDVTLYTNAQSASSLNFLATFAPNATVL